jgi:nucleoside-diphosphate-sugar epimerase
LRPGVLYGPGRDAGLTSSPTTAMKHVALGRAYQIPFCSRQDYLYAPDVGGAMGNAVLEPFDGYAAFTLPSLTLTTDEMVASMRRAAAELGLAERFQITVGRDEVPFICDLEYEPFLKAFPQSPHTPLDEAVRKSLEVFIDHARRGWLGK